MHQVAVLALHEFVPYDLGIACEVFGRVSLPSGAQAYDVRVCGQSRTVRSRAFDVCVPHGLDALARADTIVVPGIETTTIPVPSPVLTALRDAWDRGARLSVDCGASYRMNCDWPPSRLSGATASRAARVATACP